MAYLVLIVLFCFNPSFSKSKPIEIGIMKYLNYFIILCFVFVRTPPFSSGWSPSEWFKVSRGYFGLYAGRNDNSAFMTPNSSRHFL